jgi:uncharacterized protein (DUF736 family)
MEKYDNTNRFTLFTNDKKADKHPDYRGEINVNGIEYKLSAWKKTSSKGVVYLSGSVELKQLETTDPF